MTASPWPRRTSRFAAPARSWVRCSPARPGTVGRHNAKDTELLTWAKEDAAPIIAEDTRLARRAQLRAEIDAALGEEAAAWLTSG